MSLLLIDIGNTAIHWAIKNPDQSLSAMQSCVYRKENIETLLTARWSALSSIAAVVICSVASDEHNQSVQQWIEQQWQLVPQFVHAKASGYGIQNAYAEPQKLGADRWAAMVAAYGQSQKACCVLDCGTAVTFDVLNEQGQHLGGWISPGYRLFRQSLSQDTASIGDVDGAQNNVSELGRDTQQCVNFAWHQGIVALTQRSLPADSQGLDFYITGGDANRLLPLLGDEWCYADNLVLRGLALMASEN